jgi:hypothetical protein
VLTPAAGGWRPVAWLGIALAATAAMLSHTSTFAIAVPVLLATALAFRFSGVPDQSVNMRPLMLLTIAAALVAIAAYYAHFGDNYAAQLARIRSELGKPAALTDPGGRSVLQRALAVPYYLNQYYGWPALVLAAVGATALARRRDALTLTVWAWLGVSFAFLLLGVVTPIDFRHYLAAFPAVAILAGYGAAHWWVKGPFLQSAALVLIASSVLIGVRHWFRTLG